MFHVHIQSLPVKASPCHRSQDSGCPGSPFALPVELELLPQLHLFGGRVPTSKGLGLSPSAGS